jgi:hypothetical protein
LHLLPLIRRDSHEVRFFAFIALLATGSATAAIPQIRATCPTGILVAGGGGVVFINGKQASVKDLSNNNFSASAGGISVDFDFTGGEPSMSYTAPKGANGMCTITKFQPASAPAARKSSDGGSTNSMASECKGFASEKFGVRPSYVTVHPAMRDHGMYSMYGTADDKNFICTFDGNGKFVAVDATGNPDGDL